jgi:hypothetical protein
MNRFASLILLLGLVVGGMTSSPIASPVFAQEDDEAAEEAAGEPATTVTVTPTRSFVLDYFIVGGLVAAALYAVCRSGQRH